MYLFSYEVGKNEIWAWVLWLYNLRYTAGL